MTSPDVHRIETLTGEQVGALRLPFAGSWALQHIRQQLAKHPQFAFWSPTSRDYVLGALWRGRPEVGLVVEATGDDATKTALLERQKQAFAEYGSLAVVVSDSEVDRAERFYLGSGWLVLEEMVQYERLSCRVEPHPQRRLSLRRFHQADFAPVTRLDRRAFRWLWWNDPQDFLHYTRLPDVTALTAWQDDRLVGYVSYTLREGRGHIDRIAIDPDVQGQGFGAELLIITLRRLEREGGRNVGLNTQSNNYRAHSLYDRYGFERSRWGFHIIGKWLTDTPMETGGS